MRYHPIRVSSARRGDKHTRGSTSMSDTDEDPPLPPPPLAEVLPMALQMAIQGTTVEELGELLSMETWGRLGDAERQHLVQATLTLTLTAHLSPFTLALTLTSCRQPSPSPSPSPSP